MTSSETSPEQNGDPRLEEAHAVFLSYLDQRNREPREEFLQHHAGLRDLLEPMLEPSGHSFRTGSMLPGYRSAPQFAEASPDIDPPLAPGFSVVRSESSPSPARPPEKNPGSIRHLDADRRVRIKGKFFFVGDRKLYIRGVTYGPFPPGADHGEYPDSATVDRDFALMASRGINAIRTYTAPPRWLLDAAKAHGLRVMVGLPWEQHVTFLNDRRITRRIMTRVREGVRTCAGHPAVLCFAIGNEIPAPIVRWHGRKPVEKFLKRLCLAARTEDPGALFTYVNYPSTEYLHLPFMDFDCFNVYLETEDRLEAYLARLQNISGERPLIMAEIGLDSIRNGEEVQAETLGWQIRTTFRSGCAGAFIFSWSDSWYRGGQEIEDWAFGLTDRRRQPKPALEAVSEAFSAPLHPAGETGLPFISVVVCTYNGSRAIRECLQGVTNLEYENYEVIVVNDGSRDRTAQIVDEFVEKQGIRHVKIRNSGLSNARNVGMQEARGEIVAYIDDDAYPDPQWLSYLALSFLHTTHVGLGGPNLAPPDDGFVADCVANSPGGPSHVLHSDMLAEHLPGCNMAFRKAAIQAIGGFDTRFRIAGDDVDLCWRLLEGGGTLGFNPGALVWHHRRWRVRTYLRQQLNYGRAEAMLEEKWPQKYNRLGHLRWAGRLYGKGHTKALSLRRQRINHGVWGSRLFQSMYAGGSSPAASLTLMPEWILILLALAGFSLLGLTWKPLLLSFPLLVCALGLTLTQACLSAGRAQFSSKPGNFLDRWKLYWLTALLHMLQPLVRLFGRIDHNLTPWRRHGARGTAFPRPRTLSHWSETWRSSLDWLGSLEKLLLSLRVPVRRGGDCDRWDLQATCGLLGSSRLISTVEEHGQGKQMIRVRVWPRLTLFARVMIPFFACLALAAGLDRAWIACIGLATLSFLLSIRTCLECGISIFSVMQAVKGWQKDGKS